MVKIEEFYKSELLYDTGRVEIPPLFSVCLSTYNFEDSVEKALSTLMSQTFGDYEIVIHDDASYDKTCDVVVKILNSGMLMRGKRVRLFRAYENGGILANRLRAFSYCEGKWLIQTDGDDFSPSDRLSKLKAIIEALDHEPALIATNRWNFVNGTPFDEVPYKAKVDYNGIPGWVKLRDITNQPNCPNGSSGFVLNRNVFDSFYKSLPLTRIIADDPVLARRALLVGDAYISDEPLYFCRLSNQSASGSGVSDKKWIIDRYNRWNLLLQDISHINDNHIVPVYIQNKIEKLKKRMLLDYKMIDCNNLIWPFLWIKMIFISPTEAKFALKKRIKLILYGNVNASFKR